MNWIRSAGNALALALVAGPLLISQAPAQQQGRDSGQSSPMSNRPLRAADSDSPLPEGWPDASLPGKVEVKSYPAYRSAVAQAKGATSRVDGILFFSLFNHISKSGIEMTAPVVNTYKTPAMLEAPGGKGDMTMEFLYRNTRQGEPGKGVGAVVVKDHPAQTFVCLGLSGEMSESQLRAGTEKLQSWLSEHRHQWLQHGPPRRLGYHGPMTPTPERRWEVQIPIKPVVEVKGSGSSK